MKTAFVLIAFAAVVGLSMAEEYDHSNGQPICTPTNTKTGIFRNHYDPTRFWLCTTVGQQAEAVLCPQETGFHASLSKCVPWSEWDWVEFVNPPTA